MSVDQVLEISRDMFFTALLLALPSLLVSLILGLAISILQTIMSIQDQTLTFAPRLIGVALILVFTMGWTLQMAIHFTVRMLWAAAEVTH